MGAYVAVLGPMAATVDGHQAALGTPKQRLALAVLLAADRKPVPIDTLVDRVWPEAPPARAHHSLQQYASRLRSVLEPDRKHGEPSTVLPRAGGGYAALVDTDLMALDTLLREGRFALEDGRNNDAIHAWTAAEKLWRGRAYADLAGEPFADAEARRLEERRLSTVRRRLDMTLRLGRHDDAVDELRALVGEHPLDEPLWSLQVRALHGQGRRADALKAFEQAREALRDGLGLDPGEDLQAAQRAVLLGDAARGVTEPTIVSRHADDATPTTATGLPAYRTSFVGRADEIAALNRQLTPGAIITLTGMGGIGKTRLAVEVARVAGARFRDGVAFAELAPHTDQASVHAAVREAIGVAEHPSRPPAETLVTAMTDRAHLLVIDNAEHVAAPVSALVDRMATASPDTAVLVTSREPLRVPGEQVWPLGPLPAGGDGDAATELLRQRGHSANVALGNDDALPRLAERLDGMPLAIEVVAPWARHMAIADIVENLSDLLALEASGDGSGNAIAATIRGSEKLLDPPHQVAFAQLGVLASDFGVEGAMAVLDAPTRAAAFAVIGRLADASLLEVSTGSGSSRYRMLEPVRQYAVWRLGEVGEEVAVRDRHLAHYASLARGVRDATSTPEQPARFADAHRERLNIRAAHEWALASGAADEAARLVSDLAWFWLTTVNPHELRDRAERTLAAGPIGRAKARLLIALTQSLTHMGRVRDAFTRGREAVAAAEQVGERRLLGMARTTAGRAASGALDWAEAERQIRLAREDFRAAGSRRGEADALLALAVNTPQPFEEALALADEAWAVLDHSNAYVDAARSHLHAIKAMSDGRRTDALAACERVRVASASLGMDGSMITSSDFIEAAALTAGGELEAARRAVRRGLMSMQHIDNAYSHHACGRAIATVLLAMGEPALAAKACGVLATVADTIPVNPHFVAPERNEALIARLRETLGAEAYDALAADGAATMNLPVLIEVYRDVEARA
ncbi:transcriptional regulator, SARP family [Euzebya pacifica]|uniref:Transcriptional regulator, SARP family n=1 Tax=Euzebya pacifica TaxID=1608957 RepID=A0A346XVA0_9ACTN|nr:BTAD domain-containing putative transcriptional regulator [Euzebya pacifica]AXV06147.1 transcriptional regulator, SARP family [Euzebya pacifica]